MESTYLTQQSGLLSNITCHHLLAIMRLLNIVYSIIYTLYTVHYTLYTIQCTVYSVHCALNSIYIMVCYQHFFLHRLHYLRTTALCLVTCILSPTPSYPPLSHIPYPHYLPPLSLSLSHTLSNTTSHTIFHIISPLPYIPPLFSLSPSHLHYYIPLPSTPHSSISPSLSSSSSITISLYLPHLLPHYLLHLTHHPLSPSVVHIISLHNTHYLPLPIPPQQLSPTLYLATPHLLTQQPPPPSLPPFTISISYHVITFRISGIYIYLHGYI